MQAAKRTILRWLDWVRPFVVTSAGGGGYALLLWMSGAEDGKGDLGPAEGESAAPAAPSPRVEREPDAIYQNDRRVARVLDPEVDLEAKELRFGEIYESDYLLLPEECEFQKYKVLIQRVAYASRAERSAPHKGRILRGVTADLLGYREQ